MWAEGTNAPFYPPQVNMLPHIAPSFLKGIVGGEGQLLFACALLRYISEDLFW